MTWIGVAAAVAVLLGVGAVLLKRAHANSGTVSGSGPPAGLSEADRVRHIAPAEPMVGLEAALDGVTDGHGRTLREHLDAGAPEVERLRTDDDTSPILRRALDHVAPVTSDRPKEAPVEHQGDDGSNDVTRSGH